MGMNTNSDYTHTKADLRRWDRMANDDTIRGDARRSSRGPGRIAGNSRIGCVQVTAFAGSVDSTILGMATGTDGPLEGALNDPR